MNYKTYCVVSGVLFSLVSLAHLFRVVYGMAVQVDELSIPMFASWVGFVIPRAWLSGLFGLSGREAAPELTAVCQKQAVTAFSIIVEAG